MFRLARMLARSGSRDRSRKHENEWLHIAVVLDAFYFVLVSPPPGGPGSGPDCHFPKEIEGFRPIPPRMRGGSILLIIILALSAVGESLLML